MWIVDSETVVEMKTQIESDMDRDTVSALMDGRLRGAELSSALQTMQRAEACERWHVYHVIGDVLRSPELAAGARDTEFMQRLRARLAAEAAPAVRAPSEPLVVPGADRPAANDGVFRWKMVAGLASFAAVAALGWGVLGGIGPQPSSMQMVKAQPVAPMSGSAAEPAVLRDPHLDELLAAHRAATGASALGGSAGFLRNATFEGQGR